MLSPPLPPRGGGTIQRLDGPTMGTTWSVRLVDRGDPARLRAGIEARLDVVVAQMSTWRPDSDLSRFNCAPAGTWQTLPKDFMAVLLCALATAEASDGAFDPTVGPVTNLWGFGPVPALNHGPPPANRLTEAHRRVGWQQLRIDAEAGQALQSGGVSLDLSGIAKGYAVDQLAEHLEGVGIESFLVEIGGELRGRGVKPDGTPWWVTVETPPSPTYDRAGILVALYDLAIATSGDYRRSFHHDGRRYSHTLDPRTGWPIEESTASVTVLHRCCMHADAMATMLAVLGPSVGLDYAAEHGLAALFITRDGTGELREQMSPAFAAMLN